MYMHACMLKHVCMYMHMTHTNSHSPRRWTSGELSMVFTAVDAADVSMFAERAWLLDSLQDLYKLARGKQALDRQSFLKVRACA